MISVDTVNGPSWFKSHDPATKKTCVLVCEGSKCGWEFYPEDVPLPEVRPEILCDRDLAQLLEALKVPSETQLKVQYLAMELLRHHINGWQIPA